VVAMAEFIEDDVEGRLVDLEDEARVAEVLRALVVDRELRERLARASALRAARMLEHDYARSFEELIDELC